jgi:hypothetical protein
MGNYDYDGIDGLKDGRDVGANWGGDTIPQRDEG